MTGEGGPRLREYLTALELDLDRYAQVLPLLTDRSAQITVAGRVGSHAWRYLEGETACRVRLFAEERGMEADGRPAEVKTSGLPKPRIRATCMVCFCTVGLFSVAVLIVSLLFVVSFAVLGSALFLCRVSNLSTSR